MVDMLPMTPEFGEYLRDESRSVGTADSISFPRTEDEIRSVLRSLHGVSGADGKPVAITVQGARTGLAAGAVPSGGHVMNLSRATAYLGLSRDEDGSYKYAIGEKDGDLRQFVKEMNAALNVTRKRFMSPFP